LSFSTPPLFLSPLTTLLQFSILNDLHSESIPSYLSSYSLITIISSSKSVDFLIEELQQTSLTEETWKQTFLPIFKEESLSASQAKTLFNSLLLLCEKNDLEASLVLSPVPLQALHDTLEKVLEVQRHVEGLSQISSIQRSLSLSSPFLSSSALAAELSRLNDPDTELSVVCGRNHLDPRLLVLYDLYLLNPLFTQDSFLSLLGENLEPFMQFVVNRKQGLLSMQEEVLDQDITKASPYALNLAIVSRYQKTMELAKKRDFEQFFGEVESLFEFQRKIYLAQKEAFMTQWSNPPPEMGEEIEHRRKVLASLEEFQSICFDSIKFFAKRELFEGVKLLGSLLTLHQQMMQICNNSVGVIFVGLIKTGKSTIVDTFVGDHLSPSRLEPMTAIPIRYLHDPTRNIPYMRIPFARQLNLVARKVQKIIRQRGKDSISADLPNYLSKLVEAIHEGLVFEEEYEGHEAILSASTQVHDLYRLVVQEDLFPNLHRSLPLQWDHGLDSFLTIVLNLPCMGKEGNGLKFSIIDTPGVNEAGVRKLDLTKVINDAVSVCHFVVFTLKPSENNALDNSIFRKMITNIHSSQAIPTIVLATQMDSLHQNQEQEQETLKNISLSLKSRSQEAYPIDHIHPVSGKRKLMATKMLQYIQRNSQKPQLKDPDPVARELAKEFALFAVDGMDEEERYENYEEMSKSSLEKRCQRLATRSNMEPPSNKIIKTSLKNAALLSCNRAIEQSLQATKPLFAFVDRISKIYEADAIRVQDLNAICSDVSRKLKEGVVEVRLSLNAQIGAFKRDLAETAQEKQTALIDSKKDDMETRREFPTKDRAEEEIAKIFEELKPELNQVLNVVLADKQRSLDILCSKVQSETETHIFSHLRRIHQEVAIGEEEFSPTLSFPEITLDTTSLTTMSHIVSVKEKVTSYRARIARFLTGHKPQATKEVFVLDTQILEAALREGFQAHTTSVVDLATYKVQTYLNGLLDTLFARALRNVGQLSVALAERSSLLPFSQEVSALDGRLKSIGIGLKGFSRPVEVQN